MKKELGAKLSFADDELMVNHNPEPQTPNPKPQTPKLES
jgi:hypothetical protein